MIPLFRHAAVSEQQASESARTASPAGHMQRARPEMGHQDLRRLPWSARLANDRINWVLGSLHSEPGERAVTGRIWLDVIISLAAALLLSWLALVIALAIRRPKGDLLKESLRLLPDLL
jgi:hypothetical protein